MLLRKVISNNMKNAGGNIQKEFGWMSKFAPCFGVKGDNIKVLQQPKEYYDTLLSETTKSKKRVILSALYLGNGKLEKQLVGCLEQASARHVPVSILLDYSRGSRGEMSSRVMLLPLLKDDPDHVKVSLYHTPDLRNLKRLIPGRYIELIGVQHIKAHIFDDTVVLSGANLSDSYFTDRQDRYIVIENEPEVANFFVNLVASVSSFSFELQPDNTVRLPSGFKSHPYKDIKRRFIREAQAKLEHILPREMWDPKNEQTECNTVTLNNDGSSNTNETESNQTDTWIFPLIQMGTFGINQDYIVTQKLWTQASTGNKIHIGSGYFNLTQHYIDAILRSSKAEFKILAASEKVNSFYNANSPARGIIPASYTYVAKLFHDRVQALGQKDRISLYEYYRPHWTFHAKGVWYYLKGETLPSLTLIGSPNFGHRSVYRDLEAQIAVVTTNTKLKEQLHQEQEHLFNYAELVDDTTFEKQDRKVPFWVKMGAHLFRKLNLF